MDWQKGERSDNVEADSGGGGSRFGGGGRGLGLGGIVVLAILGWIFFRNPLALLDQGGSQSAAPTQNSAPAQVDPKQLDFVRRVLGSTEKTWGDIFAARGQTYVDPKLDLFSGGVNTACGAASTAVGPFYCPRDQKVYLDVAFFQGLQDRFHAGVWANLSQQRLQWLQPGEVESALNAASQIGDDTLQRESRGTVVPDSFTHGTSVQRVQWFKTGLDSGDMNQCDTFASVP